jgi:hypothetical protein
MKSLVRTGRRRRFVPTEQRHDAVPPRASLETHQLLNDTAANLIGARHSNSGNVIDHIAARAGADCASLSAHQHLLLGVFPVPSRPVSGCTYLRE